jgi:hypothetical protein
MISNSIYSRVRSDVINVRIYIALDAQKTLKRVLTVTKSLILSEGFVVICSHALAASVVFVGCVVGIQISTRVTNVSNIGCRVHGVKEPGYRIGIIHWDHTIVTKYVQVVEKPHVVTV